MNHTDEQEIKWLREDYRRGRPYKELHPQFTDDEIVIICEGIEKGKPYKESDHGVYRHWNTK